MKSTVWYRDPHVIGAVAACALGIALAHVRPPYQADLLQVYSMLVGLGWISARADVSSSLTLKGERTDA